MCKRKLILFMLFVVPSYLAADLLKQEVDTLEYAYVYNSNPVNLCLKNPMPFDSNGPMTSGITHILGSSDIVLKKAGVYQVNFVGAASVRSQNGPGLSSEVSLFLNNQRITGFGGIYGSLPLISIIIQAIITVNTGDTLIIKLNGIAAIDFPFGHNSSSIIIKQLASQ